LYLGGGQFKAQLGNQLSWVFFFFLWISSVPPSKCQGRTLIRPWTLPFKSFPIHLSLYNLMLHGLQCWTHHKITSKKNEKWSYLNEKLHRCLKSGEWPTKLLPPKDTPSFLQ
jgi:hypothetical protein